MISRAQLLPMCVHLRTPLCLRSVAIAILLYCSLLSTGLQAQFTTLTANDADGPSSIHGTVLNKLTNEPISRALVYSPDNRYAMLTDDRGQFEFKLPLPTPSATGNSSRTIVTFNRISVPQIYSAAMFRARKPGYLDEGTTGLPAERTGGDQSQVILYLIPESSIVGRVSLPNADEGLRIQLELYRRELNAGQTQWVQAGSFMAWANGEFRFYDLKAGTYKLLTREQMDADPLLSLPGGQLFGFPSIFYPNAIDFSTAASIQLATGATLQASLSPIRREYYPVKIPVLNGGDAQASRIQVYPLGHPGPGYSLGYNPGEQIVEGMLPNGNYTLEVDTQGQPSFNGIMNFSVNGSPLEASPLSLIPSSSLKVNVTEEFQSGQSNSSSTLAAQDQSNPKSNPPHRFVTTNVILHPLEEFDTGGTPQSELIQGSEETGLVIRNVRPGRYRVQVATDVEYAASVQSDGVNLLHQPLVVGPGTSNSPIDIVLRDDGAKLAVAVEDKTADNGGSDKKDDIRFQFFLFCLPIGGGAAFATSGIGGGQEQFEQQQLPPGTYRVLAFDRMREDLQYVNDEILEKLQSMGQIVQVSAGQELHLRLKLIHEGDSQ